MGNGSDSRCRKLPLATGRAQRQRPARGPQVLWGRTWVPAPAQRQETGSRPGKRAGGTTRWPPGGMWGAGDGGTTGLPPQPGAGASGSVDQFSLESGFNPCLERFDAVFSHQVTKSSTSTLRLSVHICKMGERTPTRREAGEGHVRSGQA